MPPKKKKKSNVDDTPSEEPSTSSGLRRNPVNAKNYDPLKEMLDALTCSICYDVFHDCVALQPCQHCFCAGCVSEWLTKHTKCPECRLNVKKIARNHRMNSLVGAFLIANNIKQRSDKDLADLNAKNLLKNDITSICEVNKSSEEDSTSSSDTSFGDSSEELFSDSCWFENNGASIHLPCNNLRVNIEANCKKAYQPLHVPVCAQCKNYGHALYNAVDMLIKKPTKVNLPDFVCDANQAHIKCTCCGVFMPDRRADPKCSEIPFECSLCRKIFCHLYFGCSKFGCSGCLDRMKDFKFEESTCSNIVNENHHETNILKKYLAEKRINWEDFFAQCLEKMDEKLLKCRASGNDDNFSSASFVCRQCALINFRDLAYEFRKEIQLNDVDKQQDCWYGRNCKTQKINVAHAQKLNHICEQTRFK